MCNREVNNDSETLLKHNQFIDSVCVCVCVCVCVHAQSCPTLFVGCQAPLSMEFYRQEYCSGLPFPPLGVFLTQGSNMSPESPALVVGFFTTDPPGSPSQF